MRIILAGNISKNVSKSLVKRGFEIIETPCNPNLLGGLNYHPDMQIVKIDETYVCDASLFEYYKNVLQNSCKLVSGDSLCTCNYPDDIAYNIKVVQNKVFHNFKYTDFVVRKHISDKLLIDVPQGYSGCSICNVCDRGIITADRIIAKKAIENGIDALLITPGNINLEGFDYGFIGGASFCYGNTVFFFGNLNNHPDGRQINEFCTKHRVEVCQLTEEPLSDYGSAIVLD